MRTVSRLRFLCVLTCVWASAVGGLLAEGDPHPADGDLVLPMPDGSSMVFRPVLVGGASFWGGEERIIQLGDAGGGMFEGLQRVQVSGSFPTPDGQNWLYYLGKYEVTKGHYAAVMGIDSLVANSGDPADRQLQTLSGDALARALSRPLAGLGWAAMESFIHAYNRWLFDPTEPARMEALPRLAGVPGQVRLPTEVEWEYAARGGRVALDAGTFGDPIPVPQQALNGHAWHRGNAKAKVRPVGLREPNPLGLYDMLGNVQEITAQRFLPEMWQGKPGGLVARGGSVLTAPKALRSSARAEVGIYRWDSDRGRMEEQRSLTTGMRLAIGSDVVVSPDQWNALQASYDAYKDSVRADTPVGMTLAHPVAQGVTAMGLAHASLEEVMSRNEALREELGSIKRHIEAAERKLDLAQQEGARSLARDALRNAATAGVFLSGVSRLETRLEELKQLIDALGDGHELDDQLRLVKEKSDAQRQNATEQLRAYGERVAELGEYGESYVDRAVDDLGRRELAAAERLAITLLGSHVRQYRVTRRVSQEDWDNDFQRQFGYKAQ